MPRRTHQPTKMSNEDGFDALLTTIGFGRWQMMIISATLCVVAQLPIHQVGSPFLSAPMPFRCFSRPPEEELPDVHDQWRANGTYYNDKCLEVPVSISAEMTWMNHNGTGRFTGLSTCPYIEYDTSIFASTINSDGHIVCEQENLRPLFQMVYNIGGLIGSSLCGQIGDRYGRKRSVVIGCIGHLIGVILMVVVQSYPVILVMRFILGVTLSVTILTSWSLALEVCPPYHRSLAGMLMGLPYSIASISNAGIAYYIRTWEYLLLAGITPGVILLPLSFVIDESPRWLIQKGREQEAIQVLNRAVKLNKSKSTIPIESTVQKMIEKARSSEEGRNHTKDKSLRSQLQELTKYVRSPAMRLIILLTPPLWFLQSFLYLSVAINANNFTTSGPFLYMALTGVMDASAIILSTPLATRLGRKTMIFGGMFGGALFFLVEQFIPTEYDWLKWVLVMAGFLFVASAFQVNFIYGPELLPTDIRTRGFGFLNLISQAGFVCTPIVTEFLVKHAWWAGGVLFGVSGMVGSLTILPLPETKNKPLPETLQDVENLKNIKSIPKNNSIRMKSVGKENIGFEVRTEE